MGFLDSLTGADDFQDAANESSQGYADAQDTIYQAGQRSINRFDPYSQMGTNGANALNSMYNRDGSMNYDQFRNMPGYQFRMEEGQRAMDNSGSARGMTQSGAQMKALAKYGQGSADQGFNDWFNKQMQMSGMGMNAVSNQGNIDTSSAAGMGEMMVGGADARASGMIAKGGIKNGLFNAGLNAAMMMAGVPPTVEDTDPQAAFNQNSLNNAMGQSQNNTYGPNDARRQMWQPTSDAASFASSYKKAGT
tara:strand:+ start:4204 stop:4950 length:747 start_codon:yes stop_codon:yes gene_type:complete